MGIVDFQISKSILKSSFPKPLTSTPTCYYVSYGTVNYATTDKLPGGD